jgi:hypothetical protein
MGGVKPWVVARMDRDRNVMRFIVILWFDVNDVGWLSVW